MARINNLTNFLTDVASAIKEKKGDSTNIPAEEFDIEILALSGGGNYQTKTLNITSNGTQIVTPDQDYDAIEQLTITTNVPIASLQSKSYTFTTNQTMTLSPDTGYDGFSSVNVTVNVATNKVDYQVYSGAFVSNQQTVNRNSTDYPDYKQIEIDLLPYTNRTITINNTGDRNYYGFTETKPGDSRTPLNSDRQSTTGTLVYKYTGGSNRYLVYDFTSTAQDDTVISVTCEPAELVEKNITSNGTYDAEDDNVDGFSRVVVNVPSIKEYASVQTMKEAGLGDGEKAVVYNSTDKLKGYYQVGEEEQFLFPKITDCTINSSDKTILYDYTNAIGMPNRSDLATKIGAIMTSAGWVSGSSFLRLGNILILWENDALYAYVIYRRYNGTEYSNTEPTLVYLNNQMYFSYNAGNANTNLRLKKFKLNLDESTYEEIETFTPTSTRPYNSNGSTQHIFNVSPSYIPWSISALGNNFTIRNVTISTPVASSETSVSSYTITPGERVQNREVYTILDTGLKYGSSDANALAEDIVSGKSAYVNGIKINGTRGGGTIRQYDTLEDLEEDTEIQNGELALVYSQKFTPISQLEKSYSDGTLKILSTVTLEEEQTVTQNISFYTHTSSSLSSTSYTLEVGPNDAELRIYSFPSSTVIKEWTSIDGLTYTSTSDDLVIDNIDYLSYYEDNSCMYFIEVLNYVFTGLYEHTSSGNVLAKTQLTLNGANDLYEGEVGYGPGGVITGDGSVMDRFSGYKLDTTYMNSTNQKSPKELLSGHFPAAPIDNSISLQYFEFTNTPRSELPASYSTNFIIKSTDFPKQDNHPESYLGLGWGRWINGVFYAISTESVYDSNTQTYTNIIAHVHTYDSSGDMLNHYKFSMSDFVGSSLLIYPQWVNPSNHTVWYIRQVYNSDSRTKTDITLQIYDYTTGTLVKSLLMGQSSQTVNIMRLPTYDPVSDCYYMVLHLSDNTGPYGQNKIVRYDYTNNTMTVLYSYSTSASDSSEQQDQTDRYLVLSVPGYTILVNYGTVSYIKNGTTTEVTMGRLGGNFIDPNNHHSCAYINGDYLYLHLANANGTPGNLGPYRRYLYRYDITNDSGWTKVYEQTQDDYTVYAVGVENLNDVLYYRIGTWIYLDPERWVTTVHTGSSDSRDDYDYNSYGVFADSILTQDVGDYFSIVTRSAPRILKKIFVNIRDCTNDTDAVDKVQKGEILPVYYCNGNRIPLGDISLSAFQNNKYLEDTTE